MMELLRTSLDVHLKVIITTCDEGQVRDYDSRLRNSGFDRYAVVLLEGVYSESRGMKAALSVVEENNSIVVLCDSRIKMPTVIIEEIRKVQNGVRDDVNFPSSYTTQLSANHCTYQNL